MNLGGVKLRKTLTLILFLLLILTVLSGCQPEKNRNKSSSDVKIKVDLQDVANRTPIIRTYTKEEYTSFDKKEIDEIKDTINGNIEGDIPALVLENGTGELKISFEKNPSSSSDIVSTDNLAKIKISVLDSIYSEEQVKEINDLLIESEEETIYLYEIKRYLNNKEALYVESEDAFMESMFIEIDYKIDNKNYVSIFAINTIEYN